MLISLKESKIASTTHKLFDAIEVQRQANIGLLATDRSKSTKFGWQGYHEINDISFPEISLRVADDVLLVDGTIPSINGDVITDNFVAYSQKPDGQLYMLQSLLTQIDRAQSKLSEPTAPVETVETLTLIIHNEGGGTWGHWLIQGLPRVVLFKLMYPDGRIALPKGYFNSNFGQSLQLFGIGPDSVFFIENDKQYLFKKAAFIDHLYDFRGYVHPAVIELFDELHIPDDAYAFTQRVMIDRANASPSRNIENADEVEAEAKRYGFTRSNLGRLPVADQAKLWRRGSHFMAVLGSDLANIIFAKPGAHIIAVTPDFHGDMFFFDLAAAKGLIWHELLCGKVAVERKPLGRSSFHVAPKVMRSFLAGTVA